MEKKRLKVSSAEINGNINSESQEKNYKMIYGWEDSMAVANDVWRSGSFDLLKGKLLFAYRNTTDSKSNLYQIVIVQNLVRDIEGRIIKPAHSFGISMITTGYSMLLPEVSLEYLEAEVLLDLQVFKVIPKALDAFKMLLNEIKRSLGVENNNSSSISFTTNINTATTQID